MKKYLIGFLCSFLTLSAGDASVQEILDWIGSTKQALVAKEAESGLKEGELLFLTFWNFDNTILDGDSTEGSSDIYGKVIFKGLAQVAIEAGLSPKYSSFEKFWNDYQAMEQKDERKAYAYAAQMLAGSEASQVLQLSTLYFQTTLGRHLFQASMDLIRGLQDRKISVQILTASPRIFVQGAAPLLKISANDVYGMETKVENGRLTSQMVLPLTTQKGKIKKIEEIVQKKMGQYKKVYVLAAFGNDNYNDMPFLEWTAAQQLPAGKPLAGVDYRPPRIQKENVVLLRLTEEISRPNSEKLEQ